MGSDYNWKMVFGKNKALWFLPITTGEGAPLGDGVVINKIETSFSRVKGEDLDIEDDSENPNDNANFNDPLNKRYDRIHGGQASNPLNRDVCKSFYYISN